MNLKKSEATGEKRARRVQAGSHLRVDALGGVERGHVVGARGRLLLDAVEGAGEDVDRRHGDEQQPADLEHRRPEVQHSVVLDDASMCVRAAGEGERNDDVLKVMVRLMDI